MSSLACVICSEPVHLADGVTDGNDKAVHTACLTSKVIEKLPEYVAISPITLLCPKCKTEPGKPCVVLVDEGLEAVHVERIKAAVVLDIVAKALFDRAGMPSKR
jgi:hypothetical protein